MRRHLLVTNDFPPKVGGIQNYLWDLWGRLDPSSYVVLTATSDARGRRVRCRAGPRGVCIERLPGSILFFPTPSTLAAVRRAAAAHEVDLVLLDPALPLGLLGPRLDVPYGVVLHGAEVTVPGRLPGPRTALAQVLRGAADRIGGRLPRRRGTPGRTRYRCGRGGDPTRGRCGGHHPAAGGRAPHGTGAARPAGAWPARRQRQSARAPQGDGRPHRGGGPARPSFPDLVVAIGGQGRELHRLRGLAARSPVRVELLGRVSDEDRAALLGAADLFVMACRNRWLGLEQEGFGMVFLEAAAAGVPEIAGESGGAPEAVLDGETGLVVHDPGDPGGLAEAMRALLADPARRRRMGRAARSRVQDSFDNDVLASRLAEALAGVAV